jgi:hypothetical protein
MEANTVLQTAKPQVLNTEVNDTPIVDTKLPTTTELAGTTSATKIAKTDVAVPSAKEGLNYGLDANGQTTIKTADGYTLNFEETSKNWLLTHPNGKTTKFAPGQSIIESDGSKWGFDGKSTFLFGSNKITLESSPLHNSNGPTFAEKIHVYHKNHRVTISNANTSKPTIENGILADGFEHDRAVKDGKRYELFETNTKHFDWVKTGESTEKGFTSNTAVSGYLGLDTTLDAQGRNVVTTADGYSIRFEGRAQEWVITHPDGKETKIWGDPHVYESDGSKWDFKDKSTFMFGKNKITVETTPKEGAGGATFSKTVNIYHGNHRVEVTGIDTNNPQIETGILADALEHDRDLKDGDRFELKNITGDHFDWIKVGTSTEEATSSDLNASNDYLGLENTLDEQGRHAIRTADGYNLRFEGTAEAWIIQHPDGKETKIWGDPHVYESDGSKWDFKDKSTFLFGKNKVTVETTPKDDPNGVTFTKTVHVYHGNHRITVTGINTNKPTIDSGILANGFEHDREMADGDRYELKNISADRFDWVKIKDSKEQK